MKRNKIIAVLGATVATVLASSAASAISVDSNKIVTDTDTIKVNNVTKAGDTFKACKIVDVKYDSASNVISYEFTQAFQNVKSSLSSEFQNLTISDYMGSQYASGTASGSAVTGNTKIDKLAGELASNSNFVNSCTNMTTGSTSPYSASATVAWGGYLVIPQGNSSEMTDAYGAMIVNLGAQASGNTYVVDKTHAEVNAKKSSAGSVQKTTNNTNGSSDNSFKIGETYRYVVTANVPTYPSNAVNKKFIVTDTPESGVTLGTVESIVAGNIELTIDGNNIKSGSDVVGTISNSNGTITFTFNDVGVLNTNTIVITYNAALNSNATLGDKTGANSENENSVTIQTPKNPYDTNSSYETSEPTVSTVYTYGIKITKIKQGDSTTKLQGAEFDLCLSTDSTCSSPINGATKITTDADGEATFVSVGDGSYYLKETKAPTGYSLAANQTVTITVGSSASEYNSNTGYYEYTIEDPESLFNLPFTGGRGVAVYAILGIGIVSIASAYYIRKKQQQA